MNVVWPEPPPLERVKSRNRKIFELQDAVLQFGADERCTVSSVSLSLNSHVVAVGKAGRAAADVLLGCQDSLPSCAQNRHDELVVLHLGSHVQDEESLAAALKSGPQIIVLSEPHSANEPWARLFSELVGSDGLRALECALVVCVEHEGTIPSDLCQTRWVAFGGCLLAEDVCGGLVETDDICEKAKTNSYLGPLLAQVTDLAHTCFVFELENFGVREIEAMAELERWTVMTLSLKDSSGMHHELVGYLAYKYAPAMQSLDLVRIAVKPEWRGRGHASYMVRWLMTRSRQMGHGSVTAWAKPAMQRVCSKLGFKYYYAAEADIPDAARENSWMAYRDRPMDLGLDFAEPSGESVLDLSCISRKRLKALRRKEFKTKG